MNNARSHRVSHQIRGPHRRLTFGTPLFVLSILCLIMLYMGFNLLSGPRGIVAHAQLVERHVTLSNEHDLLSREVDALSLQTGRLRPSSLDPDLLEERVKAMLGYSNPGELIVIEKPDR